MKALAKFKVTLVVRRLDKEQPSVAGENIIRILEDQGLTVDSLHVQVTKDGMVTPPIKVK